MGKLFCTRNMFYLSLFAFRSFYHEFRMLILGINNATWKRLKCLDKTIIAMAEREKGHWRSEMNKSQPSSWIQMKHCFSNGFSHHDFCWKIGSNAIQNRQDVHFAIGCAAVSKEHLKLNWLLSSSNNVIVAKSHAQLFFEYFKMTSNLPYFI